MKNRVGRVIIGILALVLFGYYTYKQELIRTHSMDPFIVSLGPAVPLHPEGFEAGVDMSADMEQAQQEPVQMNYTTPAPDAPAAPAAPEMPAVTPEPTPEPQLSPLLQTATANAAALGLPTPPDVDVDSWELMLANAKHPIETYEPEQLAYLNMTVDETDIQYSKNDYRCAVDARIAEPLLTFAQACKREGLPVYLSSGYRPYSEQSYLYQRKVGQGYSEAEAATIVARPGTSEHQTGLACDITDYYRETKDSSLENTDTYRWLSEHCWEYGFVVRYPADKSGSADSITGIIYEPWHFRYVGSQAAKYMTENHLCLEEFLALYGKD